MTKILFVCMGNICRSPAAEGILRNKLENTGKVEGKDFIIDSAGTTRAHQGSAPDLRSQTVMTKNGIDISQQTSRPLTKDDGEDFDMIICMDRANVAGVKQIIDAKNYEKVQLLDTREVEDPYYGSDGFDRMYQHINSAVETLVNEIVSASK